MSARLNVSDLGRRWGAIWAQRAIIEAVKSRGEIPTTANATIAGDFDTRVAELRQVGVGQDAIEAFCVAALGEMDRRFDHATQAMVV